MQLSWELGLEVLTFVVETDSQEALDLINAHVSSEPNYNTVLYVKKQACLPISFRSIGKRDDLVCIFGNV